jgi:CubicO group peptidase (beta-lactamase class C family)
MSAKATMIGLASLFVLVASATPQPASPSLPSAPPASSATSTGAPQSLSTAPVNNLDDRPALEAFFDGAMHVGMEEHHVTGAVVAIVKDGKVLFAKGYGKSNLAKDTPIDPATSLFRIGSTTKTLTWTAVMQLVEEGKLDLDTDVNTYLKGVKLPEAFGKHITLRDIMTHTAGFEEGFLGYLITSDPKAQIPIATAMALHRPAVVSPPGSMSAYSNYGAALAGLIVEQVSGMPYNAYIETHILEPLDMHYATVQEPVPERLAPYVTTGYKFENGGEVAQPYEIIGGFRPAGSGAVSALDMTHFMLAHLQGGRYGDRQILKPATVDLMHTTAFQLDPRFPGMALGFYHADINGRDAIGHGGDTVYCHSDMLLLPKDNVGLFVSFFTPDNRVRERIEQAFFDRYFPRAAPQLQRLPDAEAVKLAAKYSGAYQWTRRNHSDIEKVLNLTEGLKVGALQNGNLVVSGLGQDPLQFEPIGTDLYREVLQGNMQIAFRTDAGGRVTHMFFNMLPFMPTERAPWYDQASVWITALGAILLACLGALASTYYRWREIRTLPTPERRAIWTGALTALWAIATFAVLGGVLVVTGIDSLLERIPTGLRVGLVMPLVFVVLTIYLIVITLGVWRHRFWTVGRRIGYSVMAVAAILLCIFFWQWNLLGWRFG